MDVAKDWHRIAYEAERARDNAVAQLEYEQSNRRKNDAEIAHERDDFIKDLETTNADLRTALVAIQELHHPAITLKGWDADGKEITEWVCKSCTSIAEKGTYFAFPCATRRLADDALGGDNNG